MEWTAEAIETLRLLWAEGHSTAEIGRRMGISKNAVVGKAHRLNLSARPSPIRREEAGAEGRPATIQRSPVPAPVPPRPIPVAVPAPRPVVVAPQSTPLRSIEAAPTRMASVSQPVLRAFQRVGTRDCCWPIGEPGTAEFRFCTSHAAPGRPYCAEHAALAYVKVRDRREDAA